MRLSRREVLAAAAAAALPPAAAATGTAALSAHGLLAAVFTAPRRAGAVGTGCLRALPVPPPPAAQLLRALAGAAGDAPAPAIGAALRARIRAEFAAGEIVRVDGWLLSATEARLYVLAALAGAAGSAPL